MTCIRENNTHDTEKRFPFRNETHQQAFSIKLFHFAQTGRAGDRDNQFLVKAARANLRATDYGDFANSPCRSICNFLLPIIQ